MKTAGLPRTGPSPHAPSSGSPPPSFAPCPNFQPGCFVFVKYHLTGLIDLDGMPRLWRSRGEGFVGRACRGRRGAAPAREVLRGLLRVTEIEGHD